ncbi:MAG: helix-turn-helix domain-containing protein [Dissulfurispiraceae bacterium]
MKKEEFTDIRRYLGKSQIQLARLLGDSIRAVQSFEQGWRNIPIHVERQLLFLLALKKSPRKKGRPCWVIQKCPLKTRRSCPAWEFHLGRFCWFVNGTICGGQVQGSWQEKMKTCRQCAVFQGMTLP